MQNGGPIAFYEIAATLIPVLLLGGIVLEAVKAPPLDDEVKQAGAHDKGDQHPRSGVSEEDASYDHWRRRFRTRLVAQQIPLIGVVVVIVELVALDTVATGNTNWPRALLVGGTLVIGMMSAVFAVWAPWAKHFYNRNLAYLWFGYSVAALLALILVFQFGPSKTYPFFEDIATPAKERPQPRNSGAATWEPIWLEHLLATSDYRIDKLQEEKEQATSEVARQRVDRHLGRQIEARKAQREALEDVKTGK